MGIFPLSKLSFYSRGWNSSRAPLFSIASFGESSCLKCLAVSSLYVIAVREWGQLCDHVFSLGSNVCGNVIEERERRNWTTNHRKCLILIFQQVIKAALCGGQALIHLKKTVEWKELQSRHYFFPSSFHIIAVLASAHANLTHANKTNWTMNLYRMLQSVPKGLFSKIFSKIFSKKL